MIPSPLGWPGIGYLAYGDTFADHLKRGSGNYPYLGVDVLFGEGLPLFSMHAGRVEKHFMDPDYGNFVDVIAPWGRTRYAHLQSINWNVGDDIGQSGLLGWSGRTGRATGPHLHLELWDASAPTGGPYFQRVDPQLYLSRPGVGSVTDGQPVLTSVGSIGCASQALAGAFMIVGIVGGFIAWTL